MIHGWLASIRMYKFTRFPRENNLNSTSKTLKFTIPELLELIQSNQDDFIRLINEPDSAAAAPEGGGPAGGAGGLSEDMPGVISVSQQDKEAIDRVSSS